MIAPGRSIRALRIIALAAGVAALGLAAAGCGGGTKAPSVASLGTTTNATTTTEASTAGGAVGGSGPQAGNAASGGAISLAGGSIQQLTKFAACMRQNGEPSFPDPNAQGQISANVDPSSAQFQQAQQACRKLMPGGGTPNPAQQEQARVQALAFSACMRSHGVPDFPDPQFGTGGTVRLKIASGSGIDPGSPQFQAAQTACQKDLPGKKLGGPPSGAVGPKG